MNELTERFGALFKGRTDAYGTEEGGCARTDAPYEAVVDLHLTGARPVGVYPLVPYQQCATDVGLAVDWRVKWGCIDLDVKGPTHATGYETQDDAYEAALNLCTALRALSITGWIERTRSGGFHVWVFAAEWVPARTMRRALLVACSVVEVPPTEVNPKAEGYEDPNTLGNYVRLPYPGSLGAPPFDEWDIKSARRVALDVNGWGVELDEFLDEAEATLAATTTLDAAAALYVPPPPSLPDRTMGFEGEVELDEPLRRRLGGLTFTILTQGPLDGGDRSGALFKLAHGCREDGLTPSEALAVVTAGDLAWGKYHARHDGERYLRQTVERAYA